MKGGKGRIWILRKKIVQKKMNQRILVLMKDTVSFYKSCMLMVILCVSQGCSLNIAQIGDPGLASGR